MDDVSSVKISDAIGEFEGKSSDDVLRQRLVISARHVFLQVSSLTILRDHVDVLSSFEDFKYFDDITMSAFVEYRSFVFELRNVLIWKIALSHDLDDDFSLGYLVLREHDIAV